MLTFEDTELRMDQIPTLLVSEYNDCRRLLYDDLMFGVEGLRRMHTCALRDNGSVDTIDWNFTQHRDSDNDNILQGAQRVLLSSMEQSNQLCRLFLDEDKRSPDGYVWRKSAITSYEATVQEFLTRLCVLVHISGGQPIREKVFFSMTCRNTQRRRSITIRHENMIHVQYHKG